MENGDNKLAGQIVRDAVSETLGDEKYVEDLLLKLTPQDLQGNDDDLRIISVVDSEAVGKTALARSVYGRPDVKRWFAYRAWVCIQDYFSVGDVLANILEQISTSELKDVDLADELELSRRLYAYFFKQRYLLVLDNINSIDFTAKLLKFLLDSGNGSRVVITTRNVNLPDLFDPWVNPITFHPLTEGVREQQLWLCLNDAQKDRQNCPARLHLMQRILSWCNLSPAGIRLLGGLLSVKQESRQLEETMGRLPERPLLVDIVSFCYDKLGEELQRCIIYVGQFPREYEIPTRRLLRLWLAENLLPKSQRGLQDAEKCLEELVQRNMIHVVSPGKGHGFAKTCRMPGFIYDFFLQKAKVMGFFEIYSNDSSINIPNGEPKFVSPQRIVVYKPSINDRLEGPSELQEQSNRIQYNIRELRSFISFHTKKTIMPKRELDIVVNPKGEKSSLEILDLEGVYKPILPKNLGNFLLKLKYLGLRWTTLDELPKSVGNLPCLETLDIKHTNIATLPASIWTKKNLRHLYLNEMSFDNKSIPHGCWLSRNSKLPKRLETLCGLHVEGKSPMIDLLRKLTSIRKLSLTCSSTVVEEVINCIKGLTKLQSLWLKSKNLLGQPSELHVQDMNELLSLSNLYLFGDLRDNNLSFRPNNLKSLTLSMSFLGTDTMGIVARLKCLTDLRLYAFSYEGTILTCARGTFSRLRVLKLWKLANLESLIVESEAMPSLEELEIRDCQKLGNIQVFRSREALKEVRLAMVKEELAKNLEASLRPSVIITTGLVASATATEAS